MQLERRESPLGTVLIVTDASGALRALDFVDYEARMHRLLRLHYSGYELLERAAPLGVAHALDAYFSGEIDALAALGVATGGTAFQQCVWGALRQIPPGGAISYGELATRIGRVGASRAVGHANGSNPVAIVVPCHRVIGADGSLTGYGGGIERKRWLLDHEQRWLKAVST
ncbi:methylated-DNA--[protein]-cysteine S-methyltransferase [Chelatococcus reniformis]|nr:methylated-DNA--[protein]-cysteine S-methyltransferase [Chelatococcus reniformis]